MHLEGSIWEEGGKTWTIKNGIKRTTSVKDELRKAFLTPLCCPNCNNQMKHHLDEKMWTIHKLCFNCTIEKEHAIITAGKWSEYERSKITANAQAFLHDLKEYVEEFVQDSTTKAHVTEDGIIEHWRDAGKEYLNKIGEDVISDITEKVNKY